MSRGRTKSKARPSVRPRATEAEVTEQVLEAARMLGLNLARQNTGGMHVEGRYVAFGEAGDADFRGTLPGGKRLEVEIKAEGARPSQAQLNKLRELNEMGAVGIWTDCGERFLNAMRRILNDGWRVVIDEHGDPWVTDEEA